MNVQSDREYDNYRSDESDSKYYSEKKFQMSSQNNNTLKKVLTTLNRKINRSLDIQLTTTKRKFKNFVRELKFLTLIALKLLNRRTNY